MIRKAAPTPAEEEKILLEKSREQQRKEAAIVIQCCIRIFLAHRNVDRVAARAWQRVFDPAFKLYFWHNRYTGDSTWTQPRRVKIFNDEDIFAAQIIQKFVRGFIGKMRVRKVVYERYSRYYEANQRKFYWHDSKSGNTFWVVSKWLVRQNIPLSVDDKLIYDSHQKIEELERKLMEKEQEIKEVRKKRFEELEPQIIKDKVVDAKALQRSRYMHRWSTAQLAAWFTELKMEQYIPFLFTNRVDGNLFINLADDDWPDMGITNKFHARKLQLILRGYRLRHQRVKSAGGDFDDDDDDEDDGSEYSPSELSAAIAAEGQDYDDDDDDNLYMDGDDDEYNEGLEEEGNNNDDERLLQMKVDSDNIKIQVMVLGDATNFPMVGDIIRVRYTCYLVDSGNMIMSTKNHLQSPWVEFVLGIDHVIKGFDRALPQMSVGERSKLTFTPEYAYGANGLPPLIPPNASIYFDLTLLGFRPRHVWVKPLIQDEKTNEKPYHEELAPADGSDGNINRGNSKAIKILKDGDLASSLDDNSTAGSLGGGNRTSGSFAGTNRSSGGNKNSFSENTGRVSFGDGGNNKTSFNNNNNNSSFRSSFNGK